MIFEHEPSMPDTKIRPSHPLKKGKLAEAPAEKTPSSSHEKLLKMSRSVFTPDQPEKKSPSDTPFRRMLYSIPVFILFWLFYYWIKNAP